MPVIHAARPNFAAMDAVAATGWTIKPIIADQARMAAMLPEELLPALMEQASDIDYLVTGRMPVTAAFLAKAPRLRHVSMFGAGTEHIDIKAATAHGVTVANSPGGNARAVAELVLGSMFALARRIPQVHADLVGGVWKRFVGWELGGKTLGILGLGAIGSELATLGRGIGMQVIAHMRHPDPLRAAALGVRLVSEDELFACSDFLSLHIPGGTTPRIGKAELAAMKKTACLLNAARGSVVDLDALAEALQNGAIAGAGLDVFPQEPPALDHPIFSLPNIVCTPHMGAQTLESQQRVAAICVEELRLAMAGQRSTRVLNQEVYDTR